MRIVMTKPLATPFKKPITTEAEYGKSLVSSVLAGRRKLSKAMISRLHEALGIPFEHLFEPVRPGLLRRVAAAAI